MIYFYNISPWIVPWYMVNRTAYHHQPLVPLSTTSESNCVHHAGGGVTGSLVWLGHGTPPWGDSWQWSWETIHSWGASSCCKPLINHNSPEFRPLVNHDQPWIDHWITLMVQQPVSTNNQLYYSAMAWLLHFFVKPSFTILLGTNPYCISMLRCDDDLFRWLLK